MNNTDTCHLMIDIETLSTKSNAVILSIGVVQFDFMGNYGDIFHERIDISTCIEKGLHVDGDTVLWWLKQSNEITDRLLKIPFSSLETVLKKLEVCVKSKDNMYVWSHGSSFDLVVLENAYRAIGSKIWWSYKNVRDTRTLFDVANYTYVAGGNHDALEDARNQALAVVEAYKKLNLK